ncbi:MAG: M1 family metallopeptidase [Muribaculaceae bacterium]
MKRLLTIALTALMMITVSGNTSIAQEPELIAPGVSLTLAQHRKANISNVHYDLQFNIPAEVNSPVDADVTITFTQAQKQPIIIDFREDPQNIHSVKANGKKVSYDATNEHIVIGQEYAKKGKNSVTIGFTAGNRSLNRNDEYLYTLFVPDRARTAFPCFDQPDLKAIFKLTLTVPAQWEAVSNSPLLSNKQKGSTATLAFAPTQPLSTYLFAFAAGKFKRTEYPDGDRTICAYYRETDPERLCQLGDIFKQVAHSLHWMEEYTGINYPFHKYDFVILPGFQFGGMEHTGATFYNDNTLFLTQNPTPDEELARASLIAHETAHMWFGDYVTMPWFSDVWTKEVFANYFAAQITAPQFPDIDHDLNWVKGYVQAAMSEDRTQGGTAIAQPLDNLANAGLIYNNIIYNKAPVMMRGLVEMMGAENFRAGLQEYLNTYAYGNASWANLIDILAKHTNQPIAQYSDVWVNQRGMPTINLAVEGNRFTATQHDPLNRGLIWPQHFTVQVDNGITSRNIEVSFGENSSFSTALEGSGPWHIVPNVDGKGYGYFTASRDEVNHWLNTWQSLEGATKQASLIALHENWLNKVIDTKQWIEMLFNSIEKETNALTASTLFSYCDAPLWELDSLSRIIAEDRIIELYINAPIPSTQLNAYRLMSRVAIGEEAVGELYYAWKVGRRTFLNDNDYTNIAYQLMRTNAELCDEVYMTQRFRIGNPDRVRQYDFISRATINDDDYLDSLFTSLLIPENRRIEPWTASVLGLLNYPTRELKSVKYIRPGLEALRDVQRTGDIFFPARWCSALLGSHRSPQAYQEVKNFLNDNPDYPTLLKNKILNAAYMLYRANE